jgi:Cu(I)/Ag(I) efflux system protein CusF
MPEGMTMVYADPNMLISVKAGNKIIFDAERVNGQLTVTKIEKASEPRPSRPRRHIQ